MRRLCLVLSMTCNTRALFLFLAVASSSIFDVVVVCSGGWLWVYGEPADVSRAICVGCTALGSA